MIKLRNSVLVKAVESFLAGSVSGWEHLNNVLSSIGQEFDDKNSVESLESAITSIVKDLSMREFFSDNEYFSWDGRKLVWHFRVDKCVLKFVYYASGKYKIVWITPTNYHKSTYGFVGKAPIVVCDFKENGFKTENNFGG